MATLHPKKPSKPPPYDFTHERERIAEHEEKFTAAKDNNGHQPTCPYCYKTVGMALMNGRRFLVCGCRA